MHKYVHNVQLLLYSTTNYCTFYGGWDYTADGALQSDLADGCYTKSFPIGCDLALGQKGQPPNFPIHAVKDPVGANLDRVQVVTQERAYASPIWYTPTIESSAIDTNLNSAITSPA